MALYKVILPYGDASGGPGVRYATLEVEADSEQEAKRLALAEFNEMVVLGPGGTGSRPKVIDSEIKIERAPVARRGSLELSTTSLGPQTVALRLVGSLSSSNFIQLQETLDQLKSSGVSCLVLDLSGLTYVNSTGLSLFVAAGDLFDMRLAAVPSRILRLLKLIGLDKLFRIYSSIGEAASAPARSQPST